MPTCQPERCRGKYRTHYTRISLYKCPVYLLTYYLLNVSLYGLEACPLTKSDSSVIDFIVNRFFVTQFFRTNNIKILKAVTTILIFNDRAHCGLNELKMHNKYMTYSSVICLHLNVMHCYIIQNSHLIIVLCCALYYYDVVVTRYTSSKQMTECDCAVSDYCMCLYTVDG